MPGWNQYMTGFEEACLECGTMTDKRNRGFCSLICESNYMADRRDFDHPISRRAFAQADSLPTFDELKEGKAHREHLGRNQINTYIKAKGMAQQAMLDSKPVSQEVRNTLGIQNIPLT